MFVDESGNLDFSRKGTRFFVLTCVTTTRPFLFSRDLDDYRYDLMEGGYLSEKFHCANDNTHVRSKVFGIIGRHLSDLRIDSIVVEKPKTHPTIQPPTEFYPRMLLYLLTYVLRGVGPSKAIIVTDSIPVKQKRKLMEKAIKTLMSAQGLLKNHLVAHHPSSSHYGLQVADYCCWSIFRNWERGMQCSEYSLIHPGIASEFDVFKNGRDEYY